MFLRDGDTELVYLACPYRRTGTVHGLPRKRKTAYAVEQAAEGRYPFVLRRYPFHHPHPRTAAPVGIPDGDTVAESLVPRRVCGLVLFPLAIRPIAYVGVSVRVSLESLTFEFKEG